jgi:hypothetical protein
MNKFWIIHSHEKPYQNRERFDFLARVRIKYEQNFAEDFTHWINSNTDWCFVVEQSFYVKTMKNKKLGKQINLTCVKTCPREFTNLLEPYTCSGVVKCIRTSQMSILTWCLFDVELIKTRSPQMCEAFSRSLFAI